MSTLFKITTVLLTLAGCAGDDGNEAPRYESAPLVCSGSGARYVTDVVEATYGEGQDFGRDAMPAIALGPPRGGGEALGSLDVVSLGNGGLVGLAFAGNGIVDGPGADFIVFENPFVTAGVVFAELATVSVSEDGVRWHTFACDASEPPYDSCAGHHPVFLNTDDETATLDPERDGGDPFDLADLGLERARYVRIEDRADLDGPAGVFDLDAVGIVHPACP